MWKQIITAKRDVLIGKNAIFFYRHLKIKFTNYRLLWPTKFHSSSFISFWNTICSERGEILPVLHKVADSGTSGLCTNWCRGCFLMVYGFIMSYNLHLKTNKNDILRIFKLFLLLIHKKTITKITIKPSFHFSIYITFTSSGNSYNLKTRAQGEIYILENWVHTG